MKRAKKYVCNSTLLWTCLVSWTLSRTSYPCGWQHDSQKPLNSFQNQLRSLWCPEIQTPSNHGDGFLLLPEEKNIQSDFCRFLRFYFIEKGSLFLAKKHLSVFPSFSHSFTSFCCWVARGKKYSEWFLSIVPILFHLFLAIKTPLCFSFLLSFFHPSLSFFVSVLSCLSSPLSVSLCSPVSANEKPWVALFKECHASWTTFSIFISKKFQKEKKSSFFIIRF